MLPIVSANSTWPYLGVFIRRRSAIKGAAKLRTGLPHNVLTSGHVDDPGRGHMKGELASDLSSHQRGFGEQI
jgi:hypothetical protein